jgi:hypothetical protein
MKNPNQEYFVPSNTLYSSCLFRSHRSSGAGVTVGLLLLAVLSLLLSGCDRDGGTTTPEPTPDLGEVGVVVNSVEQTVTLFRVDDPDESPRTVDLQTGGDATPVGAAVRGDRALIPLGLYPAAVLVDLKAGQVIRTIGLPQGSGATGAIFLTDSTALVANPDRNSVSHLDLEAGSAGMEIEVGRYPQGFVETDAGIVVINAELENFQPAGPGTLTVLDPEAMAVTGEVTLTGQNSNSGVVTSDGRLFILHGGSWGADDGSLSEVDISLSQEVAHHEGFGDLPSGLTYLDGSLWASSWSFGIIQWDTESETFVRGPDDPIHPAGIPSSAGLGVDEEGRLYALTPECQAPGRVLRLGGDLSVRAEVNVGICPAWVGFGWVDIE